MTYLPLLERLLVMWRSQDAVHPLGQLLEDIDRKTLRRHQVGWGTIPGRHGHVAKQSVEVSES